MSQLYRKTEKGEYVKHGPSDGIPGRWFPAEGLWMVTNRPGWRATSWVEKLSEIPEHPADFANCLKYADELSEFLIKFQNEYADKHNNYYPSVHEISKAVLRFLANKQGYGKREEPVEVTRPLTLGEL